MTLLTATISGTFVRPDNGKAAMTAYIEAASVNSLLTYSGGVIASKTPVKIQADGSATVTLWQLPQVGVNPGDARWRLVMETGSNRYTKEFNLTGDITWDTIVDVSSVPLTSSLVSQAQQARDAAVAAAASVAYSTWQPSTAYVSGQTVQAPDGSLIKSNSSRSSRPAFDATEQTFWTVVSVKTGTLEQTALSTAFSSRRSSKSSGIWKPTTVLAGMLYVGHDSTAGVTFWVNPSNLFISTDNGDTISTGKGLPTNVTNAFTIYRVVRFKTLWAMIALDSVSGTYKVYTATAVTGNTALTWTAVKTLATNATNISGALGVSASGNTMCVCEYTATPNITGGPSIYRTTDGTTFSTRTTQATARHFHGVWEDPYNAGTWYALLGDGTTTPVLTSTDDGVTWTAVGSIGSGWDGVSMSFSANYVWATGDILTSVNVAPFYVFDRATKTPQVGCTASPQAIAVSNPGVFPNGGSCTSGSNTFSMGSSEQPITVDDIAAAIVLKKTSDGSLVVPSGTTILDVNGLNVTLSNFCTQTLAAGALTYAINRNERFYPFGLYGAVDPATEVFYLVADSAGGAPVGLPFRYGMFACPTLFGPLIWLDNLVTASRLVEVVGTEVVSANHHRKVMTVNQGV